MRYFDPAKINELQPSAGDLDDLQVLPFFSSAIIADLKKELSTYLAAANGTSVDADKLEWWKNYAVQLPFWSTGCRAILLLQTSSATAERVFFLLSNSFKENQQNALEPYISTSVMLQNKRCSRCCMNIEGEFLRIIGSI